MNMIIPYIKHAAGIFFSGRYMMSSSFDNMSDTTGQRVDSSFITSIIQFSLDIPS